MILIKTYKTITLPLNRLSTKDKDYLFNCNRECAKVWNECIRLNKELWEKEQKYVDRKYLQDRIKGDFSCIIPAKTMQLIIKKYLSNIKGIQQARKQGRNDEKYPWRIKKFYNCLWDSQQIKVDYERNILKIGKPIIRLKDGHIKRQKPLILKFKYPVPHNIAQIELRYDNGLVLSFNYKQEEENIQIQSDNISAIDLGEIHSITSVDTLGNNQIITGRRLRSFHRFRNKELGNLQKKLSKCTKGSRNYKKYRKAIVKLRSKSNRKIQNELHCTTKIYRDYCLMNNISQIVVGDIKNFNMNLKNNKSRTSKQKLIQWEYGKIIDMLKEKCEKFNIKIYEISEAYTSQTCPNCGNRYKPTGRNYICKECGFKMHRDVVGAYNILSKYINNGKILNLNMKLKPLKYLRI